MSDDITVSSPTVAPPSEQPAPSRSEVVSDVFRKGLDIIARSDESIDDYVAERRDQEDYANGKDISPQRNDEWKERAALAIQKASDAAIRARGGEPPSREQPAPTEVPNYVADNDPNYDTHFANAKERFSDYFDRPDNIGSSLTAADHKKSCEDWLTAYDPKGSLNGFFISSPYGPAMVEALEGQPQVIQHLASLPLQRRATEMSKLEGYVAARLEHRQQQQAVQQAQGSQSRVISNALPPMSKVRGASNPPQDLYSLANRDSADSYIKARQAQMRRAEQD
jgi:hypothetical protein